MYLTRTNTWFSDFFFLWPFWLCLPSQSWFLSFYSILSPIYLFRHTSLSSFKLKIIGSRKFCAYFIQTTLENAKIESEQIISKLESSQLILQMFKYCTAHKLTHLFGSEVLTTKHIQRTGTCGRARWKKASRTYLIHSVISAVTNIP